MDFKIVKSMVFDGMWYIGKKYLNSSRRISHPLVID